MELELEHCFDCGVESYSEVLDEGSRFFKILWGKFEETLGIPPAFTKKLGNEANRNVTLEGPRGQKWLVHLGYENCRMQFQHGWRKFVSDNKLEHGDFLVFKYIDASCFKVIIFDISGCEKRMPKISNVKRNAAIVKQKDSIAKPSSTDECAFKNQTHIESITVTSINAEKGNNHPKKQKINASKKNERKSYAQAYFVSCRRAVTASEREKTIHAANMFKSSNTHCSIIMKPSQVYQGFWLNVPRVLRVVLPDERVIVTLVDSTDQEWPCYYLGNRTDHTGLSGGWRAFSIHHNLEEGDVCIFELTKECTLRVHIFRVVEKYTPYKKVEGSKNNDQISLNTPVSERRKKARKIKAK